MKSSTPQRLALCYLFSTASNKSTPPQSIREATLCSEEEATPSMLAVLQELYAIRETLNAMIDSGIPVQVIGHL